MIRNTAEAVESNRLLEHLENYERSGLPSDARLLARDCQFLSVSSGVAQRELGDCFETHYRNANLRVAVTAELLNRMMPKREPEYAPVQDTIQGATVRGQSVTANEISVRMVPDPGLVRMELDVNGEVAAVTRSTSGPATFFTESESTYIARKSMVVDLRGIRMGPTVVSVDNTSRMRGVRTDFDRVPLFDRIARNVAVSQYDERRPAADAEVREKIAAKAKERVDHEATEQLASAAKRLHDELLGPMDSLLLDPTVISAKTTERRFEMRIRLAGPDQLGGHTAASAGPVRQPGQRADPRKPPEQHAGAVGAGRPDVRPCGPEPAAFRADAPLSAQAGRSRSGRREESPSRPTTRYTSAATTAIWKSPWRSPV